MARDLGGLGQFALPPPPRVQGRGPIGLDLCLAGNSDKAVSTSTGTQKQVSEHVFLHTYSALGPLVRSPLPALHRTVERRCFVWATSWGGGGGEHVARHKTTCGDDDQGRPTRESPKDTLASKNEW
jgi:hypothetical protein